tara:strand:- start:996 stop:1409 length:414 start_codon:yes stop_codon:yes gene_type:complete
MARPFTQLPSGAKTHLLSMAENGMLSETKAATALGMPIDQFRQVISDHKPSREIWESALSVERDTLFEKLWNLAAGGDRQAATTLLAVRHGLTEKQPTGGGGGVTVNFTLPAALDADAYLKTVQSAQKALPEGAEDD